MSTSDKWFDAIYWLSLLLRILKSCVAFSIIVLGTLKLGCDIKTSEILSCFPLKNNSVTIGLSFLLDLISAIIKHY